MVFGVVIAKGGIAPMVRSRRRGFLAQAEREEICRNLCAGPSQRQIARGARSPRSAGKLSGMADGRTIGHCATGGHGPKRCAQTLPSCNKWGFARPDRGETARTMVASADLWLAGRFSSNCSAAKSQVVNIYPASPLDGAPKLEFRMVSLNKWSASASHYKSPYTPEPVGSPQ